jgi:hypothetical protein
MWVPLLLSIAMRFVDPRTFSGLDFFIFGSTGLDWCYRLGPSSTSMRIVVVGLCASRLEEDGGWV